MNRICFAVLLCTVAVRVFAQQPEGKHPYDVLYAEWKSEVRRLQDAFPDLSKNEILLSKEQVNARYTPRFAELAESHRDDEDVWLRCVMWGARYGSSGQSLDRMFDLIANNIDNVGSGASLLVGAMDDMPSTDSDRVSPTLALLANKHAKEYVRGNALFTLAYRTKRKAEKHGDPVGCAEAEKLLQQVILEYPNIRNGDGPLSANAALLLEHLRSPVAITKMAPNVSGFTIDGDPVEVNDFKGRVTLISFSAHWCAPCVAMHPIQKKLQEALPADKFKIIEINADKAESLGAVKEKMKADGLTWLAISDGQERAITKKWRVRSHPTYYVIDADGRIRHRGVGAIGTQLIDWVEALVRDKW